MYPLESTFCKVQVGTTAVGVYAHSMCNTQTGEQYQWLSNHDLMRRYATYGRPNACPHQLNELLIVLTPYMNKCMLHYKVNSTIHQVIGVLNHAGVYHTKLPGTT